METSLIPKEIQCLALAPGPSLHEFLATHNPMVPTFGCSRVTKVYDKLTYYCYGDSLHEPNLPKNPETIIYARPRLHKPEYHLWDINLPDCGSTGGMAISLACTMYDHVGLVGYDGRTNEFGEDLPREYIIHFTSSVLDYWSSKGKKLYNLMGESIYSGRLL